MDLNPATATVETEEVLHNASDADHSTKSRPDDDPEPQGAVYIDPEMGTDIQDLLKALDTGLQKRTVQRCLSNQAGEDAPGVGSSDSPVDCGPSLGDFLHAGTRCSFEAVHT